MEGKQEPHHHLGTMPERRGTQVLTNSSQNSILASSGKDGFRELKRCLMLIGYARVSTTDQHLDLQQDALTAAGCEKIFSDVISGAKASRPGLDKALEQLRDGDTLVVWKLDRLGRSVKNLIAFTDQLQAAGVGFRSLTDQIDTTTPAGRFFFHVMASLAQMERELTIERTRAGLEAARKNGRQPGRKRLMTDRKIMAAKQLLAQGTSAADVAHNVGVSIPTLYRWIPATDR